MNPAQRREVYRRQFIEAVNELLPPQSFSQFSRHGNAGWSPQKLVWVSLLMNWMAGATMSERFLAARKLVQQIHPRWTLPREYSGFVGAQRRWWPQLWPLFCRRLRPDKTFGDAWRVQGWLVLAVDGSRFECPRTAANEAGLKCAGREKTGPQIYQTSLMHVGTGLPWDMRLGPGTDSERRHLDQMLPDLPPQSLLTADAGFLSYGLGVWLCQHQQTCVLRVGGNFTLLENLGSACEEEGRTVYLWPKNCRDQPPLVLRKLEFHTPGGLPVVLLTNELDATRLTDEAMREIYAARWGIELYFRMFKQTWGPVRA